MNPRAADVGHHEGRSTESTALHALAVVARRHGLDIGFAELQRNYALPPGEPKTGTLIAIARDLGLEAQSIKIRFKDLVRLAKSLPAILRTNSGAALILEGAGRDPKAGPLAILRDPTSEDAVTAVDEAKLAQIWNGEIILVKRRYARADD